VHNLYTATCCELSTRGAQCSPYFPIILATAPERNRTRDSVCAVYDDVARRLVRSYITMRFDMHKKNASQHVGAAGQ
jgi:hypothetical protein